MCEPPGVELLADNGIDELFFGEAKVLWGVSEENHTGCWSIQRTGKAVTVGPIKLNPDGGAEVVLVAWEQTTAEPLNNNGDGNVELAGGFFGGDEAVGSGCAIFGKLGHAGGDVVLVAQMANPLLSPVGDRLADEISGIIFDVPGGDEPFLVEDGGNFVIGKRLGQGADAAKQG